MCSLRSGFTTGICAAAAAKAAVEILIGDSAVKEVEVRLPDGEQVCFPVVFSRQEKDRAVASVRKDAGDDPDVSHGALVVASVSFTEDGDVTFAAGEGVGMVTKAGLSVAVGEPAINPVPRQMIRTAVREITDRSLRITLSIPGGKELAAKTFNPRLGVIGGLSILGTSGRVRPFSCPALRAALRCSLDVAKANGIDFPVFVPGRIGEKAVQRYFSLPPEQVIQIANEWGYMIDSAVEYGFRRLLALGHPGKLAKLAIGDWDTHSSRSRAAISFVEEFAVRALGRKLPESGTVEGLMSDLSLEERRIMAGQLASAIQNAIRRRTGEQMQISVILIDLKSKWLGSAGDFSVWRPSASDRTDDQ